MEETSTPTRFRRAPAALLLLSLTTAAPAAAQEFFDQEAIQEEFASDPESMDTVDLLERRERGNMHPGDPFALSGLDQGEEGFRRGLHAASRGAYEPALVDRETLRDRQLAMYEGGSRFSTPLRRAREEGPGTEAPRAAAPDAPPAREDDRSTTWVGIVLAAVSSVAYFLLKGRVGS